MRKLRLLAASVLILALGVGSAFAISSADRLDQTNSAPAYGSSAPSAYGELRGFSSLAPSNTDDASQPSSAPLTHHGR